MRFDRLWRAALMAAVVSIPPAVWPGLLEAQQMGAIRGRVVAAGTEQALGNVQVSVAGTGIGSLTTEQGDFVLEDVPSGRRTLQAELLGYGTVTHTVDVEPGGTAQVTLELSQTAVDVAGIVVVGYGERARRELATAVASVSGEVLRGTPVAGVDGAIQGRLAGVQVTQNAGNPGNGVTLRVRGASSISAGNQPLWVIDGMPMQSEDFSQLGMGGQGITAVTNISPDDIESIDILKDAAATAIYGSRGSNGVVVITTKRGRAAGESQVSFSAYAGSQQAARRLDLLNAAEYLEFFNESAANDGRNPQLYGVPGVDDQNGGDWQDALLRSAPVNDFELAFAGGGDRSRYRVSGTLFNQDGIVRGSQYRRATGRANLDFRTSDRLAFAASLFVSREDNDRVEGDGDLSGLVTNMVANQPLIRARTDAGGFTSVDDGLLYPNSLALAELNATEALTQRALASLEGRLQIADALQLTSRVGFDILSLRETQYESPRVIGTYAASAGGVAKSGYSTGNRYTVDGFLTYDDAFGARHALDVTVGGGLELNDREVNFIRGEGLSNDRLHQVRNAAVIIEGDATVAENNLVSLFSRVNYNFAGRYFLGGSLRADGSSRFGENDRYGVFPAASAAWLLSEETFLQDSDLIDELKVRASYGVTGNQSIGDYPYQGLAGSANYGDLPGLRPASIANPDLKWESTAQANIGVDLLLVGGRIGLRGDYYRKETRDLLLNRPITTTSGFSSVYDNVGNIENRGIELELATVNFAGGESGFRWNTSFNIAANDNEVTRLFGDEPFTGGERDINRVEVGQPLGAFYAIRFIGVDPQTGDAMYDDVDGDGSITSSDRQIVGSPHADFNGGLTNTFGWGGLDLNVFFTFSQGNEIFNAVRLFSDAGGYYEDNQLRHVLSRWRQPGDITDVPRASYGGGSGARTISSRFIEDGSYVRLQEVTLGYQVPARLLGFTGMRSARLYVSGQNLKLWTDYLGYDPDVNSNGASANLALGTDFYAYPLARTFTIGIRGTW